MHSSLIFTTKHDIFPKGISLHIHWKNSPPPPHVGKPETEMYFEELAKKLRNKVKEAENVNHKHSLRAREAENVNALKLHQMAFSIGTKL